MSEPQFGQIAVDRDGGGLYTFARNPSIGLVRTRREDVPKERLPLCACARPKSPQRGRLGRRLRARGWKETYRWVHRRCWLWATGRFSKASPLAPLAILPVRSFSIPPSPAIRKFSPTLPMHVRS